MHCNILFDHINAPQSAHYETIQPRCGKTPKLFSTSVKASRKFALKLKFAKIKSNALWKLLFIFAKFLRIQIFALFRSFCHNACTHSTLYCPYKNYCGNSTRAS